MPIKLLIVPDSAPLFLKSSEYKVVIGEQGNKPGKGLPGPGTLKRHDSSKTKKCRHQRVLKCGNGENIVSGFSFGKLEVPINPVHQIGNADRHTGPEAAEGPQRVDG
jgi:hypothetical protein